MALGGCVGPFPALYIDVRIYVR